MNNYIYFMDVHVPQLVTCEASIPPTQTVEIAIIRKDGDESVASIGSGEESGESGTDSSACSAGLIEHEDLWEVSSIQTKSTTN